MNLKLKKTHQYLSDSLKRISELEETMAWFYKNQIRLSKLYNYFKLFCIL